MEIDKALTLTIAFVGLALAALNWLGFGFKNSITYKTTEVKGMSFGANKRSESDGKIAERSRELTAISYEFYNHGFRHLTSINIRLDNQRSPFSYQVGDCTNVDGQSIDFSMYEDSIVIVIPDLPPRAKFSVHTFGYTAPMFPTAKGHGSYYNVKSEESFLNTRIFVMIAILTIALFTGNIAAFLIGKNLNA